ncbi:MAG: hemolysin family protein, partial [Clostridiales bacterium]|nr:hemolysin family protein [Clostridiales bacterium]
EMIHNIFELDNTQVENIMTHRTDTELLWLEEKDSWKDTISASNHSIYPVCHESIDNIVGTINSKDFYRTLLNNGDVEAILRQPYFVPETLKADDLFRQMQKTKIHFAVVLDEYGGLGGIITMSDLLEEIVGSLSNEYDEVEEDDIVALDSNTYKISGSCDIDLVSETLGVDLPVEEYNTFAGMILGELGEVPEDGTTPELEAYGLQIKVTEIRDHRIESALVTVLEKVQDNE